MKLKCRCVQSAQQQGAVTVRERAAELSQLKESISPPSIILQKRMLACLNQRCHFPPKHCWFTEKFGDKKVLVHALNSTFFFICLGFFYTLVMRIVLLKLSVQKKIHWFVRSIGSCSLEADFCRATRGIKPICCCEWDEDKISTVDAHLIPHSLKH